jgi:hypothetical protein
MTTFLTVFTFLLSNSFSEPLNTYSSLTVRLFFISTKNTGVKMGYDVLTVGEGRTTKIAVIHPEEESSRCMCNRPNVITFLKTYILQLSTFKS